MLIGAEMNALLEHSSPEGKDPGEKVPGQKEAEGIPASRGSGARDSSAPARLPQPRPAFARRSRTSELLIGGAALVAELAAVIAMHVRRVRTRS